MSDTAADNSDPRWVLLARAATAAGAALLSYGAWLAWRPGGYLVSGALLLIVGVGALRQ